MNRFALIFLLYFIGSTRLCGQGYNHLLRLYEDNDFINILGKGTDKGYTNGIALEYYFLKPHASRFFIDKVLPAAGKNAVNTFSYSLTQLMIVPRDLSKPQPDRNDWPYSGALFLTHSLHSANPLKKFSIDTKIIMGVIGPLSLAREAQSAVHRAIGSAKPMGWDYQMPNDALVNVDLFAEKMIWQNSKSMELIAGGQLAAGTMVNSALLQMQFRIGDMQPYFKGYIPQFSSPGKNEEKPFQFYFFVKPAIEWQVYNALLDGGVFSGRGDYYNGEDHLGSSPGIRKTTAMLDIGVVLMLKKASVSFTQKQLSPLLKGVSSQVIGNISFTYGW